MIHRFLLASAIFFAAFLLFQIQPLTGKVILPWFGGSAAVWSTCLLFFQFTLWLGYLYAHWLATRFSPSRQAIVHVGLLAISLSFLPIDFQRPSGPSGSYLDVLFILGAGVGPPYLFLSATGPLLQAWSTHSRAGVPYRLFSLSNAASLAGLVAYPFLIEPFTSAQTQATAWSWSYAAAVALSAGVAVPLARRTDLESPARLSLSPIPLRDRALWFLLPACASSLLIGITTGLTQNVAPIPLLWIVPLSLYLVTFILCFERDGWYDPQLFRMLLAGALLAIAAGLLRPTAVAGQHLLVAWYSAAFFLCCMFCHGELARLKPRPEFLTSFYLTLSFGGAAGGVFASLLAPQLFRDSYELPLSLLATAALAAGLFKSEQSPLWRFWAFFTAVLAGLLLYGAHANAAGALRLQRSFYGILRVVDDPAAGVRALFHGTVNHGQQFLRPDRLRQPTTYYGRRSGVGLALRHGCPPQACRAGLVGLGAGTLAAYSLPSSTFRFYEINPQVIDIARTDFTFLSAAPGRVDIVPGDARLSLESEPPQNYDVLVVDAFSGDSVPVHLLTREAAALYLRHLKPGGVLALHISNNFLNLAPLIRGVFAGSNAAIRVVQNPPAPDEGVLFSEWVLVTANQQFLQIPEVAAVAQTVPLNPKVIPWADDYSNILPILR
jgi:hypothetical protein